MHFRKILRKELFLAAAVILAALAQKPCANAAQAEIPFQDLPAACEKAKSEFHPIDLGDVQQSKEQLIEALSRLDRRLDQDGANGEAWRKYLQGSELQAELHANKTPDKALLLKIYALYCAEHEGLDLVWFGDVQRALHNFNGMLYALDNPNFRTYFDGVVKRLDVSLKKYVAQPNAADAQAIAESVRFLEGAHQCPALVRAIKSNFDRPNLYVEISPTVIGAGLNEKVDDVMPISDCILGTDVHGTAHTVGGTRTELWPDPRFGVIDALFFGNTDSENVGYHGGVTICSHSETDLAARKRIWIDAHGLSAFPAVSKAETSVMIDDIQARRRLIARMAWRKAGKQLGMAESIASQHAEERLSERIDRQAADPIERANEKYVEKYQRPFSERQLFPRQLDFSTNRQALQIVGVQASERDLAAHDVPPPVADGAEMSLRVHESTINNLAFEALAGRTVYEEKVQKAAADLLGKLPEKMKGDEDGKPWAISLDRRQPITVSFADQQMSITIRGVKFYKGDEAHPAMNVSATYKIEKTPKGFKLVRQGDIEVIPPDFVPGGEQKIDARRHMTSTVLKKRFEKVFEPEFLAEGFEMPGKWKAAGKLRPIQFESQNGWLTIAWKRAAQ